MNIYFNERIKLNGGIDRKINEWQLIDVHLIPKIFQQNLTAPIYLVAEYNFQTLNDEVLEKILTEFKQLLQG